MVPSDNAPREGGTPNELGEGRRNFRPRHKFRWPVVVAEVSERDEPPAGSTLATTCGVSVGGAFIEAQSPMAVGTALHLWLHPPGPLPPALPPVLRLRAIVRWCNTERTAELPQGFGVQFRAITAEDEVALHGYFSAAHKVV